MIENNTRCKIRFKVFKVGVLNIDKNFTMDSIIHGYNIKKIYFHSS
jgi:hypothetical protein